MQHPEPPAQNSIQISEWYSFAMQRGRNPSQHSTNSLPRHRLPVAIPNPGTIRKVREAGSRSKGVAEFPIGFNPVQYGSRSAAQKPTVTAMKSFVCMRTSRYPGTTPRKPSEASVRQLLPSRCGCTRSDRSAVTVHLWILLVPMLRLFTSKPKTSWYPSI